MKLLTALISLSILAAETHARGAQVPLTFDTVKPSPPAGMELHALAVSGDRDERVNLAFFADGYTHSERTKFLEDAQRLTDDIVAAGGPMSHVRDLVNVWGVFVPSNKSGLGQDAPLAGAPFGLYREGPELRGVYAAHTGVARAACTYFREGEEGGCDQAILLGNDPLYGGLGGEFTIITASKLNGPLVLRHELGHSLIPVGEEYEGGYYYFGANAEIVEHLHNLSWAHHLSEPESVRIEDMVVPLQAYPWHDLDGSEYSVNFRPTKPNGTYEYETGLVRISLSSLPVPEHVEVLIGGHAIDLIEAFPDDWAGSKDRRWVEVPLAQGLKFLNHTYGEYNLTVRLTEEGRQAEAGQGGKMVTSVEIIEYAGSGRCNTSPGFIGAFPTYAENGSVTLRPMNEECIMRRVTHPTFCPPCAEQLRKSLEGKIADKRREREHRGRSERWK